MQCPNRLIFRSGGDDDTDYTIWRDRNRVVVRDGIEIEMETASETEA